MRFLHGHIAVILAAILTVGCKSSSSLIQANSSTHRDSVSVHVVDSYHTRSIFDSLAFSVIYHDTILRVERIFREISNAGSSISDTVTVHQRDTININQVPVNRFGTGDSILVIIVWVLGVLFAVFVHSVWSRR